MTGSDKQVKWAEEIKARYISRIAEMEEIVTMLEDTSMIETVDVDPLFGNEVVSKSYKTMTGRQQGTYSQIVDAFCPDQGELKWGETNESKLREKLISGTDGEHKHRLANAEIARQSLEALKAAIETEDNARYWIDRR